MKRCTKCGLRKGVSEFDKSRLGKYGVDSRCRACKKEYNKKRYASVREQSLIRRKMWRKNNQEKSLAYGKEWYQKNIERLRAYREKNRAHIAEHQRAYGQEHRKELTKKELAARSASPQRKLAYRLRQRLYKALKGGVKTRSAVESLGCSVAEAIIYIECLFKPGMFWGNWGSWHIDHIKPLASFDLEDPAQFEAACRYTNLRPIWKEENQRKGKKLLCTV